MKELNLLPPTRRLLLSRQLVLNALIRFLQSVAWGLALVAVMGIAMGITFDMLNRFLSGATTAELKEEVKHYQDLRATIAKQNQDLAFLAATTKNRVTWSDFFADLAATMPPGTHIGSFVAGVMPQPHLMFSGIALSRSSLVVLEDRLRSLPWVKNVDAPNSNLLQRLDPAYTFDITINPSPTPTP